MTKKYIPIMFLDENEVSEIPIQKGDNMSIKDVRVGETFIRNNLEYIKISEDECKLIIPIIPDTKQ